MIEPKEPIEPIDKKEPTLPTDRIEYADPIDKIDPSDRIERIEREEPRLLRDPFEVSTVTMAPVYHNRTSNAAGYEPGAEPYGSGPGSTGALFIRR